MTQEFHAAFVQKAHKKQLTSTDMALNILVKGVERNQDLATISKYLKAAFKPISNPKKIAGGHYPNLALFYALGGCAGSNLDLLTDDQKAAILLHVAALRGKGYTSFGKVNL
jgi:hypothetical protein